jgi:O-antigen ligase
MRVDMAIISWSGYWASYVQGFEVFLVDLVLVAIYLSLPHGRQSLPFRYPIALYFLAVLLSAFQANTPEAALFYVWQLMRIFFVYAVITKACVDDRVAPALLKGLAIALCVQAAIAIWERFGLGVIQAGGSFGSQNLLGMMSHFLILPFFALLLAGQRGWLLVAVSLAGAILTVLTTSRATIGLAAFGYLAVFMLSILRGWTSRKAHVALFGAISLVVLIPLTLSSFENRFSQQEMVNADIFVDDSRATMARAASMILSDHPMGIGANHYVVIANIGGYNQRAGVDWVNAGTSVHNLYWLVAAETGYIGVIALAIMMLRPLTVALICGWRNRKDPRGDLLLGLGVALLIVYLHSFYEWIFVTSQVQYLFAVSLGLVAGLAQQLGYWQRTHTQSNQFGASGLARPATKAAQSYRTKSSW